MAGEAVGIGVSVLRAVLRGTRAMGAAGVEEEVCIVSSAEGALSERGGFGAEGDTGATAVVGGGSAGPA